LGTISKNEYSVLTDTRNISSDCIYIGLKGPSFDGGDYAQDAILKGAKVIIVNQDKKDSMLSLIKKTPEICIIIVDDTYCFLEDMAVRYREILRTQGLKKIIAITGSNGKTTTKEMLSFLLESIAPRRVAHTFGNFNNHIGVPLTILKTEKAIEYLIVEIGTNHPGEIKKLCEICDPDCGIITNIGDSHLEFFKNRQGVYQEKLELLRYLEKKKSFNFVTDGDDEFLGEVEDQKGVYKVGFGKKINFTYGNGICTVCYNGINHSFANQKILGQHNFKNLALAVSMTNLLFPNSLLAILEAATRFVPSKNRSQFISWNNITIFSDAYNANPSSMEASLKGFVAHLKGNNVGIEKCLFIIGDMYELGESTEHKHIGIGKIANELGIKNPIFVGRYSGLYQVGFGSESTCFNSVQDAKLEIKTYIANKDWVFLKGSRGVMLEKLFDFN